MDDEQGINKYFAAFHLFDKIPHTVIMDDFGDLFEDRYSASFPRVLCELVCVHAYVLLQSTLYAWIHSLVN